MDSTLIPNYMGDSMPSDMVEEGGNQIISETNTNRISIQNPSDSHQNLVTTDNLPDTPQPSPSDFDTIGNAQSPLIITTSKVRRPV